MATQGIISIIKNDEVVFKCVAGCNGMTAAKTVKELKKLQNPTLEIVYDVCLKNDFGCDDCLIVQSKEKFKGCDELPKLYIDKFNDAHFNPRWDCGIASYVEIINI